MTAFKELVEGLERRDQARLVREADVEAGWTQHQLDGADLEHRPLLGERARAARDRAYRLRGIAHPRGAP